MLFHLPKSHQGGEQDGFSAVPRICEFVEIEMCTCDATAGNPVQTGGRSAAPQPSQGLVLKMFVVALVILKGSRNVPVNGEGALILTAFPVVSFPWNSLLTYEGKGGTPESSFSLLT